MIQNLKSWYNYEVNHVESCFSNPTRKTFMKIKAWGIELNGRQSPKEPFLRTEFEWIYIWARLSANKKEINLFESLRSGRHQPSYSLFRGFRGWLYKQTLQQTYFPKEVQVAFKILMTHWILQFAWRIAFRCVLHRCGSQDIRCWKCWFSFFLLYWWVQFIRRREGANYSKFDKHWL